MANEFHCQRWQKMTGFCVENRVTAPTSFYLSFFLPTNEPLTSRVVIVYHTIVVVIFVCNASYTGIAIIGMRTFLSFSPQYT